MDNHHLAIGGIDFTIGPSEIRLVEKDPLYQPFMTGDSPLPGRLEVPASLRCDSGPETAELPLLCATKGSWSAFQDRSGIVLEMRLPADGELLWRARLDPQLPSVTVHCGDRLVRQQKHRRQARTRVNNPLHYPLDQMLIVYLLAARRGLVLHAAGICAGEQSVVFVGRSGAGKTTLMRLLGPSFAGLSDDRVVVRRLDSTILAYGTPWAGEGRVAAATAAPLRAIVFLHQASQPRLVELAPTAALHQLLPASSILWYDRERITEAFSFIESLLSQVPAYELHFRPQPEVIDQVNELLAL